jgi:hypothetical protein
MQGGVQLIQDPRSSSSSFDGPRMVKMLELFPEKMVVTDEQQRGKNVDTLPRPRELCPLAHHPHRLG